MKMIEINKTRYRKHLNIVMATVIACLAVGSLAFAQLLIFLFPSGSGSHFHWNLLGVVVTAMTILLAIRHFKDHPFLFEVQYVWLLKKELSLVSRKIHKLEDAALEGNKNAMLALQFSYSGSRQLWTLDDNTITMEGLNKHQQKLDETLLSFNINLDLNDYHRDLLNEF